MTPGPLSFSDTTRGSRKDRATPKLEVQRVDLLLLQPGARRVIFGFYDTTCPTRRPTSREVWCLVETDPLSSSDSGRRLAPQPLARTTRGRSAGLWGRGRDGEGWADEDRRQDRDGRRRCRRGSAAGPGDDGRPPGSRATARGADSGTLGRRRAASGGPLFSGRPLASPSPDPDPDTRLLTLYARRVRESFATTRMTQ